MYNNQTFKIAFLILFLFGLNPAILEAKEFHFAPNSGVIKGIIVDKDTKKPVDYAQIALFDLNKSKYSDALGNFEFQEIPAGTHILQIYRIGYENAEISVIVKENETKEIQIELVSKAIVSETIVVKGIRDDNAGITGKAIYQMSGEDLRQNLSQTIAQTVDGEPGMSSRSMGPAPARPVLRGLGGDRLLILEDGARTGDLSATSNDHAVVLDPLNADKIEIYRGPEALQFGSNTIAGVINVWNRNIATTKPEKANYMATLQTESVNQALATGLSSTIPYKDLVFKVAGSLRTASDMQTPSGTLDNTSIDTYRLNTGISLIKPWGFIGVSGSLFDSGYGIPGGFIGAHPKGVNIDIQRKQIELKSSYLTHSDLIHHIDFGMNFTQYYHQEYESNGFLGVEFGVLTYSSSLSFHGNEKAWGTSTFGLWSQYKDYANGGFVFTPNTKEREIAAYWYNEKKWENLKLKTTFRYDVKQVSPNEERFSNVVGQIEEKNFNSWSGALELTYQVNEEFEFGTRAMRTFRAPGLEELFSAGPHLAAYSYEIGSADNTLEVGFNNEIFVDLKSHKVHSQLSVYRNRMFNYLFPKDIDSLNLSQLLPVFRFDGQDAVFYGAEMQTDVAWTSKFSTSGTISYTWAQLLDDEKPVPFIPPLSGKIQARYKIGAWNFTFHSKYAAAQLRTGAFEEKTSGFVIFGGGAEYIKSGFGGLHMISLNVENLLNTSYRNHLSRVKSIMPEPGININLLYRVYF